LAAALALCPDQSFSFDEIVQLNPSTDASQRLLRIDKLLSADIVKCVGDEVKLAQRSWVPLLRATLTRDSELDLERRLAELFEHRDGQAFRAAQHWFRAAENQRALDLLSAHSISSQELTARGPEVFLRYVLSLPEAWI
jgi:hypothetical protein